MCPQARDELYTRYPEAKHALCRTGGDFPFLRSACLCMRSILSTVASASGLYLNQLACAKPTGMRSAALVHGVVSELKHFKAPTNTTKRRSAAQPPFRLRCASSLWNKPFSKQQVL